MKAFLAALFSVLLLGSAAAQPATTRPSAIDMLTANCVATHLLIGGALTPGCGPIFGSTNVASTVVQRDGSGGFAAGAITASSFNGLAVTSNAGNTLTIAAGKTATINNTLTFTGTDGSSVAFGAGGTVLYANQTITLSGDVTGSGTTAITTALATAQPAVHTWALAQTFTVAPVFTDASGSRTALGLGALATQNTVTSALLNADVFSTAHSWGGQQTFTAPILGTPASGTVTNLTGTASININGTVGATTANTVRATVLTATTASGHAIGAASPGAGWGLYHAGTINATGGFAINWQTDATLNATANGDSIQGLRISATPVKGAFTSVTSYGLYVLNVYDYAIYALDGITHLGGFVEATNVTDASSSTVASVKSSGGIAAAKGIWAGTFVQVTPTVVNSLPTCNAGADGIRAYVTNNNTAVSFGGAVTTGGTTHSPVYCDGAATAWKQG